jgi:acyl-CoA thioester hydrolase
MARVKIELPERLLFKTELTVRSDDLNYGKHLANDRILAFAHEARVQFLKSLGYGELDFSGQGLIMSEAIVSFRAEAFQGDHLIIEVGVTDVTKFTFDLIYRVTDKSTKKEVALIKTGMVCFDYEKKKVALISQEAKDKLNG